VQPNSTTIRVHFYLKASRQGRRIQAMLITKEGGPDEKLIGIITVWGIPGIHERL
jgi:hypothetical protein